MILDTLAKIANHLDKKGDVKSADAVDKAIMKIAAEIEDVDDAEILNFPDMKENIKKFELEGTEAILTAFLEAVIDGAFQDLKEVKEAARYFLKEYVGKSEDDLDEDGELEAEDIGEIIEVDFSDPRE